MSNTFTELDSSWGVNNETGKQLRCSLEHSIINHNHIQVEVLCQGFFRWCNRYFCSVNRIKPWRYHSFFVVHNLVFSFRSLHYVTCELSVHGKSTLWFVSVICNQRLHAFIKYLSLCLKIETSKSNFGNQLRAYGNIFLYLAQGKRSHRGRDFVFVINATLQKQ